MNLPITEFQEFGCWISFLFIFDSWLGGLGLFYTPYYQYLKAVSLISCLHILNVSQYLIQKLPCPSNWPSVGVHYFFSFEEGKLLLLIKSKWCLLMHIVRCRFLHLKSCADVLTEGTWESFQSLLSCRFSVNTVPSLCHNPLQCSFSGFSSGSLLWFIKLYQWKKLD